VARAVGVTEATARRRLDWLQRNGHLWSRAVVEPSALGFPMEAVLWIRVRPEHADGFSQLLMAEPRVREACSVAGDFDLMVNVAVEDQAALYEMIGSGPWREKAQHVEVSVVLDAMKRSGVRLPLTSDEP
jgi:Lrp/AsnC family transcriptional regulator for asnA, asnC and gidA